MAWDEGSKGTRDVDMIDILGMRFVGKDTSGT